MTMFTSQSQRQDAPQNDAPLKVAFELLGCECAGKTVLNLAIVFNLVGSYLNGLFVAARDPVAFNSMRAEMFNRYSGFSTKTMDPSLVVKGSQLLISHEGDNCIDLRITDPVGQANTVPTHQSDPEWHKLHQEQAARLANGNVIGIVLPAVPTNATLSDQLRFDRNVRAMSSNLHQALAAHDGNVSVVIIGSKVDILFDSVEEAREALTDEKLLKCFEPLVRMIRDSKKVAHAAVIPTSGVGFNTTTLLEDASRTTVDGEQQDWIGQEPAYVLKKNTVPAPVNTDVLMAYVLKAGCLAQIVDANNPHLWKFVAVMEQLDEVLSRDDAWFVTIPTKHATRSLLESAVA